MPDSAATATAFLAGVKANYYTVGVNGNVKMKDCAASLKPENQVDTIIKWAQDAGKDTGISAAVSGIAQVFLSGQVYDCSLRLAFGLVCLCVLVCVCVCL